MGSTGNSTGSHLDFMIIVNNAYSGSSSQRKTVNPEEYVSYDENGSTNALGNTSSSISYALRGEIKTEYDESASYNINENDEKYKISNESWINFVYKNALSIEDDSYLPININDINNNSYSKLETKNILVDENNPETINNNVEDIFNLMNNGDILPGDILIATPDGGTTKEYLLYVGGTKIIYATPTLGENNGALKYEYVQYYLKGMKDKLKEKYRENDEQKYEDIEIPVKYGILGVYRIGGNLVQDEYFTTICEDKANLIFNGKGYYNPDIEYIGIPTDIAYTGSTGLGFFEWLFNMIWGLVKLILNLFMYAFRMVIVGWTSLIESIVQTTVLSVGGSAEGASVAIDKQTGINAFTASENRVSIESIFFNKIPILDANFFNFKTAGGYSLLIEKNGEMVPDTSNVVYVLRSNLAGLYYIIRNLSIATLLFVLIYLGIRMALTSIAEKKAEYKKLLIDWVIAFAIVFLVHLLMYGVLHINQSLVHLCEEVATIAGTKAADGMSEMSLYEAVRTKAYAFQFNIGTIGMIFYIVMVYLLIRFLLIYFKRYITIYILALSGSFMGVKYALDKIAGKRTTSFGKWVKEFTANVLLQSVHAFIYSVFMAVALSTAETSLAGLLFSFVILNVLIHSDKIFMKIFGIDKASSLEDVNKLANPWDVIFMFKPVKALVTNTAKGAKNLINGDYGIITLIRLGATGKDNLKDARKELQKKEYERIGRNYRRMEEFANKYDGKLFAVLPVGVIKSMMKTQNFKHKRLLGKELSSDTNKAILKNLETYKKMRKQRFTRGINTALGLGYGTLLNEVAIAQTAEDPKMGLLTAFKGAEKIKGYKSKGKFIGEEDELYKLKLDKYKEDYNAKKSQYENSKKIYNDKLDDLIASDPTGYKALADLKLLSENKDFKAQKFGKTDNTVVEATFDKFMTKELRKLHSEMKKAGNKAECESIEDLVNAQSTYSADREEYVRAKNKYNGFEANGTRGMFELGMDNVNRTYINAHIKDKKDIDKAKRKQTGLEQLVAEERELNRLMEQLKEKTKQYAQDNGKDIAEARREMNDQLDKTLKYSKNSNVKNSTIKAAIAQYLYDSKSTKINEGNINDVLDIIVDRVNSSNQKNNRETRISITDDMKNDIKSQIGKDVLDSGLSKKDAAVSIAMALSEQQIIEPKSIDAIQNQEIKEIHQKIADAYRKIDMLNQVSNLQNKEQLVSKGKVVKNARKKSKEV